jgi:hypothetical protein
MVTSKQTLQKIREIIEKHYSNLMISVLGRDAFSKKELDNLKQLGVDTSNRQSLLSLTYFHNFINNPPDQETPVSIQGIEQQQSVSGLTPEGEAHDYTVDNINDKTKQYIKNLKEDVVTRIEGIIRENNDEFKMDSLKNLDRTDFLDDLMRESTLGKVKQKLRDTSKEANRDWERIAVTEMSNAIGIGSADRIVSDNRDENLKDVFVFRIIVNDAKTCKYCRRFYSDTDGSPALYRLSTLLSNGSNYGRKSVELRPVVGATHPQERCSPIIELKPGFKLLSSGQVTYIGLDKWQEYISDKLRE